MQSPRHRVWQLMRFSSALSRIGAGFWSSDAGPVPGHSPPESLGGASLGQLKRLIGAKPAAKLTCGNSPKTEAFARTDGQPKKEGLKKTVLTAKPVGHLHRDKYLAKRFLLHSSPPSPPYQGKI
ncbi:hypothetical protein CEXT_181381 [Caerostris extrusa]|uniref:Uncharacterized protein n=1 Tax=Caerostris extrusa TaxID=172846 RepID=A0AAV4T3Y9_CAEEX|nr:hypothetical protein CEXT_181381 [Caerostris extrusa]